MRKDDKRAMSQSDRDQIAHCQECGKKIQYPKVLCDDCWSVPGIPEQYDKDKS